MKDAPVLRGLSFALREKNLKIQSVSKDTVSEARSPSTQAALRHVRLDVTTSTPCPWVSLRQARVVALSADTEAFGSSQDLHRSFCRSLKRCGTARLKSVQTHILSRLFYQGFLSFLVVVVVGRYWLYPLCYYYHIFLRLRYVVAHSNFWKIKLKKV